MDEDLGRRGSCPTARGTFLDEVTKGGPLGTSPRDSRSFANNPLSVPMAGGNEISVVGLATDNRLRPARRNSQREVTAVAAHVVHLTPVGPARDIRLRLAPRKSSRDGSRHEEPAMATHVPQKMAQNLQRPRRQATVAVPQFPHLHIHTCAADDSLAAGIPLCRHRQANAMVAIARRR